jgi:hypothetical protein
MYDPGGVGFNDKVKGISTHDHDSDSSNCNWKLDYDPGSDGFDSKSVQCVKMAMAPAAAATIPYLQPVQVGLTLDIP